MFKILLPLAFSITLSNSYYFYLVFFTLFHASPTTVNFGNFGVCYGAASGFEYLDGGEVNLTEFKNVKQVGKNTYSLFIFF